MDIHHKQRFRGLLPPQEATHQDNQGSKAHTTRTGTTNKQEANNHTNLAATGCTTSTTTRNNNKGHPTSTRTKKKAHKPEATNHINQVATGSTTWTSKTNNKGHTTQTTIQMVSTPTRYNKP